MKKNKNLMRKYREIITYVIFGILTTLVNLILFWLFNIIFGKDKYLLSNFIAWFFSVIFAYFTNKIWVFKSIDWHFLVFFKEILSFIFARVLSLLIEEAGLLLLVTFLHFDTISISIFTLSVSGEMIAKLILSVVVVISNYIFSKLFIFKKDTSNISK